MVIDGGQNLLLETNDYFMVKLEACLSLITLTTCLGDLDGSGASRRGGLSAGASRRVACNGAGKNVVLCRRHDGAQVATLTSSRFRWSGSGVFARLAQKRGEGERSRAPAGRGKLHVSKGKGRSFGVGHFEKGK